MHIAGWCPLKVVIVLLMRSLRWTMGVDHCVSMDKQVGPKAVPGKYFKVCKMSSVKAFEGGTK